ncbi:MAG: hypothetical protein GF416_02765 [Candidatus Altiarchaeales archaeon]|nr:hypothetical protein [Candidatus Altiarchaeales archaeon]MBD3416041.1 hypothetical protein [Candidatus Altiarchaeales archaeon]
MALVAQPPRAPVMSPSPPPVGLQQNPQQQKEELLKIIDKKMAANPGWKPGDGIDFNPDADQVDGMIASKAKTFLAADQRVKMDLAQAVLDPTAAGAFLQNKFGLEKPPENPLYKVQVLAAALG